ncbi:MAG TPA: hypothetical protein VFX30_01940, partial [bacterium]|nr:hypothetical protein [bacterium]
FEASQVKFRHYESDVAPKGFQIGFSQLLEAVDDFCPACEGETLPAYGEPGYLDFWHSAHGPFSLQAIGLSLVDRGWMTESDLNNVLRANFSEEILRTGGFKAAMTRQPWKMQLHRTVSPAAMRFVEEIHGGTGVPTD